MTSGLAPSGRLWISFREGLERAWVGDLHPLDIAQAEDSGLQYFGMHAYLAEVLTWRLQSSLYRHPMRAIGEPSTSSARAESREIDAEPTS
jgi:hypothetical protein